MKIGFIGMGIMGLPMAVNLVRKGKLPIVGFDAVGDRRELFLRNGGISTDNTEKIVKDCNIIFLCLPSDKLVEENIINIINAGNAEIIVDLSSTSPNLIRKMYHKCKDKGVELLDSPVSGGEVGATEGTLAIMCGGSKETFDKVEYLLHYIGKSITYMGGSGCGAVAKLANNMIVACNIGAVSEAFAFGVKAGLNPEVLYSAIKDGFAGSAVLDSKAPKIISRNFVASARIAVHQKDLKNAVGMADDMNIEIPLSEMILDFMNEMEADGRVNEDHCAIAKIYEKRMGVEIKVEMP